MTAATPRRKAPSARRDDDMASAASPAKRAPGDGRGRSTKAAPVATAEDLAPSIGTMIRRARKHAERTLQQLADATELSISYLSQIERNLLTPSVSTLRRIAEALGIPAGTLAFARESRRPAALVSVQRRGEQKRISFAQSSVDYALLTPDLRRRASALWIVAKPGAESGPRLTHEGEDVVVVLKGTISVEVGEVWHDLHVGDSIHLDSELPHRWANRGRALAEAIWISTPPAF